MKLKSRMRTGMLRFLGLLALGVALVAPAEAQDATLPPAGQQAVLTVKGDGVQIYACKEVAGVAQWVFEAPEAKLLDGSGKEVGTHGAGPFWKVTDGSLVKGKLLTSSKAPGTGDIAWLLLRASGHEGSGALSAVEYIRRSDTHGGVAPAAGCDAGHLDATARIAYTATYAFYAAKP
ncbi:MAG: DUF3455 domain-containing protein [Candidatus Acidiferrum sp.]